MCREGGEPESGRLVWERSICCSEVSSFLCSSNLSLLSCLLSSHKHNLLAVLTCCKIPFVKHSKKRNVTICKAISANICPAWTGILQSLCWNQALWRWEGSPFTHAAPWITYFYVVFFFFLSKAFTGMLPITNAVLWYWTSWAPQISMSPWIFWQCSQKRQKAIVSSSLKHSEDFCQLVFPLMVYGVRGSILPQQVNPVKIQFHMWNWGLENNPLASLPLIYFPYDREIYTHGLFLSWESSDVPGIPLWIISWNGN